MARGKTKKNHLKYASDIRIREGLRQVKNWFKSSGVNVTPKLGTCINIAWMESNL